MTVNGHSEQERSFSEIVQYKGRSSERTWVSRVATNTLISLKHRIANQPDGPTIVTHLVLRDQNDTPLGGEVTLHPRGEAPEPPAVDSSPANTDWSALQVLDNGDTVSWALSFWDYGAGGSLTIRLLNRTEQIEQLMGKRNEEKSDVVVGELKAAREKLDGHYRAFVTYLNAVQELQPEKSRSKAAQYYNADLAKIDLQYQQSRKKGGKDEPAPETEEA